MSRYTVTHEVQVRVRTRGIGPHYGYRWEAPTEINGGPGLSCEEADQVRDALIGEYGYHPEDVEILDHPDSGEC